MPETAENYVQAILTIKRDDLPWRQKKEPLEQLKKRIRQLKEQAEGRADQWSLRQAILTGPRGPLHGGKRLQVIAEIRKATPGQGRMISDIERRGLARTYTHNGATAISVVTEPRYHLGDVLHLLEARNILDGYYPGGRPSILRRDYLFDPYHIWESRAFGADAVELIVEILTDEQLRELMVLTRELEMDPFVEVRDERGLERALAAGADIVGIDTRDPQTFEGDLSIAERLRPLVPESVLVVSLGGIRTREDAERAAAARLDAILVGKALITGTEMRRALQDLLV